MDKIILETDLFDRLERATKFLGLLPTVKPITDQRPTKDISQSRFATKDISVRRKPTEITNVKTVQPVTDKLEQDLIKKLEDCFE